MRYGHCFYSTERWGHWSLVRSLLRSLAASACGGWSPTQGRPPGLHWMVVLHCSINVWMSRRWMNEWVNGWTCEGRIPPTISPAALGNLPGHGGKQPCPFWATTLWRSHSLSLSCHPLPPGYKWAPPYCPSSSPQQFHPPVGTPPPPTQGEAASAGSQPGFQPIAVYGATAEFLSKRRAAVLGLKHEERWAEIR